MLRLIESVPKGTHLYVDRFFLLGKLVDVLQAKGLIATGNVMEKRMPAECNKEFSRDHQLQQREEVIFRLL